MSQLITKFINDQAVTESKIADEAVTNGKIQDAAVTTDKIADGAVHTAKILDGAVTTSKILDNAVNTNKIASDAVTTQKIADGAVTTSKIADDAVTAQKIADGSVETAKIADDAVTTSKVADDAINGDKIRLLPDQALRARNRDDNADIDILTWSPDEEFYLSNIAQIAYSPNNYLSLEFGNLTIGGITAASFSDRKLHNSNGTGCIDFGTPGLIEILPQNLNNQTTLAFREASTNGGNYIGLRAPASVPNDYTITLPASAPAAGQILQSDGSGNLSWVSPTSGSATFNKETFVLTAGDISNGYVDLAEVAVQNSIVFLVRGAGVMLEGASYDYSVNYTGGNGGKTRITWLNDLATNGAAELVAGDVLQIQYQY
jgi:hypothetical protein